jgi:hypothetical protein
MVLGSMVRVSVFSVQVSRYFFYFLTPETSLCPETFNRLLDAPPKESADGDV